MLSEIERKLSAILGDGLVARVHLSVVEGSAATPAASKGVLAVSVAGFSEETSFVPGQLSIGDGASDKTAAVRRVLPVKINVRLAFQMMPADATPAAAVAARILILEDISLAAHLLAADNLRDGTGFATNAADLGFTMLSLALRNAATPDGLLNGAITADLHYRGTALIWPPGMVEQQGKIRAVDPILEALPVATSVDNATVAVGSGTRVRVRSVAGRRLGDPDTKQRTALQLAVTVVSDLPLGQRGTITSGDPGVENGYRIITVADPETVVDYKAPVGDPGTTRVEFVAFHLATPDGHSGVFLGSAAVALVPGVAL